VSTGKSLIDALMILNHKDAIEYLIESASEISFNRFTIMNLHAVVVNKDVRSFMRPALN